MRVASLVLLLTIAASSFAQSFTPLFVRIVAEPEQVDPGEEYRIAFIVETQGVPRYDSVQLHVELPPRNGPLALDPGPWTCTASERVLDCTATNVFRSVEPLRVAFAAPAHGRYGYKASVAPADRPKDAETKHATMNVVRTFRANDEPSLRQALDDANALCDRSADCRIVLAPSRIELTTALPAITLDGALTIEGSGATLDGTRVASGSGLELRGRGFVDLRDLAIESFPTDGLQVSASGIITLRNLSISGNRFRGISFAAPDASLTILDATIRGNGHSGIALWAASAVTIASGTIEGNGASGIFAWKTQWLWGSPVVRNNAHFGVAMVPGATRDFALSLAGVRDNGIRNVDWALDGESPRDVDERDGIPNAPEVTVASHDARSGETLIRVRLRTTRATGLFVTVTVVAGSLQPDGTAAAERTLLVRNVELDPFGNAPVDEEISGFVSGLRPGDHVSVYAKYAFAPNPLLGQQSEVSRAVRVE